jgi:acetylornithine deacetylase
VARVAVAWDDWARHHRDQGPAGFRGMCLNIATLDGGAAFNVVPAQASMTASLRPPPGVDVRAVAAELSAVAAGVSPATTVRVTLAGPSFATRDPASFRRWLGPLLDGDGGRDLGFWTEAALLSQAGIDAVVLGPGDIAQAHAANEWVSRGDLDRAVELFKAIFSASRGPR